jgi:hypothetical protein
MAEVRHLPTSDHAIRALHAEIERLASLASSVYISRTPIRVDRAGKDEIQIWHDGNDFKVLTAGETVHVSGTLRFASWPDWYALSSQDARRIANALLSAAAYVPITTDQDLVDR